jgi:hypothetical protein
LGRLLAGDGAKRPISVALFDLDVEATKDRDKVQVFRLGGDEFVLVVPECGDPRVVGEIVDTVLNRLAKALTSTSTLFALAAAPASPSPPVTAQASMNCSPMPIYSIRPNPPAAARAVSSCRYIVRKFRRGACSTSN